MVNTACRVRVKGNYMLNGVKPVFGWSLKQCLKDVDLLLEILRYNLFKKEILVWFCFVTWKCTFEAWLWCCLEFLIQSHCVYPTEEIPSPTDLQFFEVSDSKITITWTASPDVSGYRVSVAQVGADGLIEQQTMLPIMRNTYAEVTPLEPGTLYRFFIFAIKDREESEPLVGEHATSKYLRNSRVVNRIYCWCHPCREKANMMVVLTLADKDVWSLVVKTNLHLDSVVVTAVLPSVLEVTDGMWIAQPEAHLFSCDLQRWLQFHRR